MTDETTTTEVNMGARDFICSAKGQTASEAFEDVTSSARHEHGHGGYTGTIAEKTSFKIITIPESFKLSYGDKSPYDIAERYANELIQQDDLRIVDKWGDAGCIKVEDGEYLFFGFASS